MGGILLFTFLGCLALGVPIAFSIAVAGTVVLIAGDVNLLIVVQRLFAATDSFSLVAVLSSYLPETCLPGVKCQKHWLPLRKHASAK